MLTITASFFLPGGGNDLAGLAGLQVVPWLCLNRQAFWLAAALVSIGRRFSIRR